MPSFKGRDLALEIGDGAEDESFATIGAARVVHLQLFNPPVDATAMGDGGLQRLEATAGVQEMEIALDGLFKDAGAEELLRAAAFGGDAANVRLSFPNGDVYQAAFMITAYERSGEVEGLERFSVVLQRAGTGTFTAAE